SRPLAIGPDAAWFEPPNGSRVDIARRRTLRRVLARLGVERRERPGAGLSADELFAAGWPGERVDPRCALNRVRVALATLRKLGLREHHRTRPDGYSLDPAVPMLRSSAS